MHTAIHCSTLTPARVRCGVGIYGFAFAFWVRTVHHTPNVGRVVAPRGPVGADIALAISARRDVGS
eukprot:3033872-Prymnesium_polylepis.1